MSNSAFSKASQDNFNNLSVSVTGTSTRTLTIVQSNGNTISTTFSISELDPIFTAHTVYNISNGVGFLKNNNGVWSYDNSTYSLSTHNHELGSLLTTGITANLFPIANGTNGVSFTAIKTINGSSILGSGNITVGGGDVYKVGVPVNNQLGIWTGNGTIKGTSNLKFGESQVGLYIGDPDNFSRITLGNTHGYGNATITHTGTYIDYSFADTYRGILKIYNTGGIKIPLIPAKTSETNILYFNSTDGSISYGAAPTGGGMVYPSGTGITLVSGGNSWGTTITIPNNTTTFLRGDGTFASIVPQWTVDTYGINYIGNVGIGRVSEQNRRLSILGSSEFHTVKISNSNANGNGLVVNTTNTTNVADILSLTANDFYVYRFTPDGQFIIPENTSGTSSPNIGYGVIYEKSSDKHLWFKNSTGSEWDLTLSGSGSGTPGGSSGSIQYNNGGAFGGFGNWNGSTLSVTGAVSATSNIISSAAVGTTGGGGSIGITGGYMYMPNMTAPSAPVSGMGYLYVAGTPGQEKIYFKNSTQAAYDLTLIGTGFTNPMTTKGDMIYGDTGGVATRIGIGATGQFLTVSAGGIPAWTSYAYTLPLAANGTRGGVQVNSTDGGLKMVGEYVVLDISRLNIVAPALEDYIAFNDVTDGSTRKATFATIQSLIGGGGGGSGTVTSIGAGNGMNFSTITTSGNIVMGTPSAISITSTNGFPTSTTHTHSLDLSGRYVYSSGSLTGGGNLGSDRTLSLVNDNATPGNSMLYGTNSSGVKGWYSQPSGGSGMVYPGSGIPISTGSAWGTSITDNSSNWNTAYTDRLNWDGGSTGLEASTGRTSLGGTTIGQSMFTLTNPSAITFPRFNADNTVSALSASDFKTAIGFGSYIENQNSIYQTANAKISGTYTSSARNAFFIGSKLMLSDYTWGGISTNVWIGGATNNTVTGSLEYEGNSNIAIGLYALSSNTTGYKNNAIGVSALNFNTVGKGNNAIGFGTLGNNTTGNYNTAIGISSLALNSTGSFNNAIGDLSLYRNESGYQNNAIGHNALYFNTTGVCNNALGSNALYSNTTSNYNNAFGDGSLYMNTIGFFNNAIGCQTLYNNTTGQCNSAFGHNTGKGITTGSNNTIIGANVVGLPGNLSNNIIIATGDGIARATYDGYNWKLSGSTQVGNNSTYASSSNVGAIRYRSDSNNSYCEMVMQTGASTYAWVVIKQNTW